MAKERYLVTDGSWTTKKGRTRVPWGLLILVAGLVLRFGVDGYNLLGDILIWFGAAIMVLGFILFVAVAALVSSYNNSLSGKLDSYSRSLTRKARK